MKILFFFILMSLQVQARDITTNSLILKRPPKWLQPVKVRKITNYVENKLEWKIKRVPVYWHRNHETYSQAHSLGPGAAAVTVKSTKRTEIHIGPDITEKDYEEILGHELVHVIFYQKYKNSIPDWLEEGFANFYARKNKVDKKWLARQNLPADVTSLGHPFKSPVVDIHLTYKISQAMVEFLSKKCDLSNLLRLSVKRNLEDYIKRTCGIDNFDREFKKWLNQ